MTEDIVLSLILVPIFIGTPRLLPHDFFMSFNRISAKQSAPILYPLSSNPALIVYDYVFSLSLFSIPQQKAGSH